MNKKGFTLVELIGVITLLGIIALIIFPAVTKTINSSKEQAYLNQIAQIEKAAKEYTAEHTEVLPANDGIFSENILLSDLIRYGYLDKTKDGKLYNPKTKEEMNGCVNVIFNTDYNQYIYTYDEACTPQTVLNYNNYYVNYGGQYNDYFSFVVDTKDGGYLAVGRTNSSIVNNQLNHNQNEIKNDIMIVKFDSKGNLVWEKLFGGSLHEWADDVEKVEENGQEYYLITGWTESYDGDLERVAADSERRSFLLKYDVNGNLVNKRIFNNDYSRLSEIKKIEDGYILVGWYVKSSLENGEILSKSITTGVKGSNDALIMKLDDNFNVVWSNIFGGNGADFFLDVLVENDKFVVCGYANSTNGDMSDIYRDTYDYVADAVIVTYDKNGNLLNKKAFGSSADDSFNSIVKTSDGYIVSGNAIAGDIDLTSKGGSGAIVVKYDFNLNLINYNIISSGNSNVIIEDGENLIVISSGVNSAGYNDGYITRIDKKLNILKSTKFNGGNSDNFYDIIKVGNGYVIAGSTFSKGKTVYDVVDPYLFGVEDGIIVYYDENLKLNKQFTKTIELLSVAPTLVKNYGTSIPSYENIESLELYTTNDPTKDLKHWCTSTENYYGAKDNYKYTYCLRPFNGNDVLELYEYTNAYGLAFKNGVHDYKINKNLDKIDINNTWFKFYLYSDYTASEVKLLFNGTRYTVNEAVELGYIEPLVIYGFPSSEQYKDLLVLNDASQALNAGQLENNAGGARLYMYFKTKTSGFEGISFNATYDADDYRHIMLFALRNFDISLSKAE